MVPTITDSVDQFRAPQTMTPEELGDTLAQLVWESFSDFMARDEVQTPLDDVHPWDPENDQIDPTSVEEALIFFLWAHTRGVQLAFLGRAPEPRIRQGLDALHRAVFEDMADHGTPRSQLPIFEQRVSARYAEYHQAASRSDGEVGSAVCRHLSGEPAQCERMASAITERAIAVANPLKDFLQEVELVDA